MGTGQVTAKYDYLVREMCGMSEWPSQVLLKETALPRVPRSVSLPLKIISLFSRNLELRQDPFQLWTGPPRLKDYIETPQ
jgi:hypothetical protein